MIMQITLGKTYFYKVGGYIVFNLFAPGATFINHGLT